MISSTESDELAVPPECSLLRASYKKSGLTVADLAAATGLSVATISIALSGIRYRDSKPRVAVPADRTLVRLASVLHIDPQALRRVDRDRAADLLDQVNAAGDAPAAPSDVEAVSAAAGRAALARQVLAIFSSEELLAELERRERFDHEQIDREALEDLAAELRADQNPL